MVTPSTGRSTDTVMGYITKCIEDVTVSKDITKRANQKPWMTRDVCMLLKTSQSGQRYSVSGVEEH